jgi:hypothetical protein
MKHLVLNLAFVVAVATCGFTTSGTSARADGYYFYGAPSYYLAPVYSCGYQPYYVAPAPVVTYGYEKHKARNPKPKSGFVVSVA